MQNPLCFTWEGIKIHPKKLGCCDTSKVFFEKHNFYTKIKMKQDFIAIDAHTLRQKNILKTILSYLNV